MIRSRAIACAALTLLGLSSVGCRRHRPPRYVDQPPPPGPPAAAAPPDGPPGPPPDGPPPGPPPSYMGRPRANRPPPPQGNGRTLTATGAAQSITRLTRDPVDEVTPSPSPNGSVVLFETRVSAEGKVAQQSIFGIDAQGSARTPYSSPGTKSGAPVWLPNGSYLFVTDASGKPALVRSLAAAPNAATATVLATEAAPDVAHPSPSPDGKRIAFEATLRGKTQIAVAQIDGSRLTPLGEGQRPSWSPDGKHIVFTRTVLDYSQIFVVNADGSGVQQLTTDAADHDDPSWAPSSKLVVFNSNKGFDRQGGSWNLFVVKPDGTGLLQLTEGNADTGAPSWGNDGWIYFDSNQGGSYDIWKLRPQGEIDALGNRR